MFGAFDIFQKLNTVQCKCTDLSVQLVAQGRQIGGLYWGRVLAECYLRTGSVPNISVRYISLFGLLSYSTDSSSRFTASFIKSMWVCFGLYLTIGLAVRSDGVLRLRKRTKGVIQDP